MSAASSWSLGPLVAFDLETTGVDVETARIVTACVAVIDGTGFTPPNIREWLINPGIDIPAEATKIHGVTTEHAQEHGRDAVSALEEILTALEVELATGTPLVAYNAPYDLTVYDRECRRHGVITLTDRPLIASAFTVIDPLVIDKHVDKYRRGSRTLEAVCRHYGVTLDGAHDSTQDALAAARLAWRIAHRHREIGSMHLDDLHDLQVAARAEQAAGFRDYLKSQGKPRDDVRDEWPLVPFAGQAVAK